MKRARRSDDSVEPVAFHALPATLFKELLNQVGPDVPAVIDLTPADPALALACLEKKIPYLGVCFTADHRKLLATRLAHCVFQGFSVPTSPTYKQNLATILRKLQGEGADAVACPASAVACPAPSAVACPAGLAFCAMVKADKAETAGDDAEAAAPKRARKSAVTALLARAKARARRQPPAADPAAEADEDDEGQEPEMDF